MKMRILKPLFLTSIIFCGLAYSETFDFVTYEYRNPECRTIIQRLKDLHTPSQTGLHDIQLTVESMDEAKRTMNGEGYKFVIDSMSRYMNTGTVPSDQNLVNECERVLEDTRLASTQKPAQEFYDHLNNLRTARERAQEVIEDRSNPVKTSCLSNLNGAILISSECQNQVNTLIPIKRETTELFQELNTTISLQFDLASPVAPPATSSLFGYKSPATSLTEWRSPASQSIFRKTGSLDEVNVRGIQSPLIFTDRFSVADCKCSSDKVAEKTLMDGQSNFNLKQAEVKRSLNNLIIKSVGEKFQNSFALNFEDLSYFMNSNDKVFSSESTAVGYQCAEDTGFLTAINSRCSSKSSAEKDQRLKQILGVTQSELGNKLKNIARETMGVETGKFHADGSPVLYTREDLDGQRRQLLEDSPTLKSLDKLIYAMMKNSKTNKLVEELLASNTPKVALHSALLINLDNPSFLETLSDDVKNSDFFKTMKSLKAESVNDNNKSLVLFDEMDKAFKTLIDNHPGVKALLRDKENFKKFKINPAQGSGSIVKALESEKNFLNNDFSQRCLDLQKNLAEAVCAEEPALLSQVNPFDLEKLIIHHAPELTPDIDIYSDLICRAKGKATPAFSDLDTDTLPLENQSDYIQRLMSKEKGEEPKDMLTSYMKGHLNDPTLKAYMDQAAKTAAARRSSFSGLGRIGNDILARNSDIRRYDPSFEKSPESDSFVAKSSQSKSSSSPVKTDEVADTTSTAPKAEETNPAMVAPTAPSQNFAASGTVPAIVNNDTKERADNKAAIQEFIDQQESRENVDRLLSNTDDASLRELNRLTEENERSKQELLKLNKQSELLKLQEMENRLKSLQEERSKIATSLVPEESNISEGQERRIGRQTASFAGRSDIAEGESIPNSRSFAPVTTSRTQSGQVAATANTIVAASEPFVVRGGTSSSGLEIKSADLSEQLLNYLSQNETQVSSLIQLKDSGMLYKYKVMENGKLVEKEVLVKYEALTDEVKKLIDQKIASNGENGSRLVKLDQEILELRRNYSYASLKNILAEKMRK